MTDEERRKINLKAEADARIDYAVARARAEKAIKAAKAAPQAPEPAKATPRAAPPVSKQELRGMKKAVAEAVAREITEHRRERELQAAKIETALAKLDAALARAEAGAGGNQLAHGVRMITR